MLPDVLSNPRPHPVVADPPLPTGYAKELADLIETAVKPPEHEDPQSQAEPIRRAAYQYD
jgi:hypothetical protein